MAYACTILEDSIVDTRQQGGRKRDRTECRLTTFSVTFPRIILAEQNTHRMLSKNSASSRAIPVEKRIQAALEDPFIPVHWGKRQAGMQAMHELEPEDQEKAKIVWLQARDNAVASARELLSIGGGVHKQVANRLLEPWLWQTVIISGTEWGNFFGLRTHPDAQPEFQVIAKMMEAAYDGFEAQCIQRERYDWHLPLVDEHEYGELLGLSWDTLLPPGERIPEWIYRFEETKDNPYHMDHVKLALVSAGRCARVSYLTHEGKRDPVEDVKLALRLQAAGHMSPFEHPSRAAGTGKMFANYRGWKQLRKFIPHEANFRERRDVLMGATPGIPEVPVRGVPEERVGRPRKYLR